ncbi:MAG TPA: RNA methyltransferase substrate-binding domain-containing protein, partial [Acidimicrobiales bacterium]|nr:RNA methyltransferase substrate-binding domain-containing protein [Acidimicrobiales bacterium]
MTRLRRLLGRKSARQAEKAYVVEGIKLVEEALRSGADVESVYWSAGAPADLLAHAHDAGVRLFELAPGVMERVADAVTPQPVMAVVAMKCSPLDVLRDASMVLVGTEVRD